MGQALAAGEERREVEDRQRGEPVHPRQRRGGVMRGGLSQLSWTVDVSNPQGERATIRLTPSRTEPEPITGPVPVEWAMETVHLMLAQENEIRKVASGNQLQL